VINEFIQLTLSVRLQLTCAAHFHSFCVNLLVIAMLSQILQNSERESSPTTSARSIMFLGDTRVLQQRLRLNDRCLKSCH